MVNVADMRAAVQWQCAQELRLLQAIHGRKHARWYAGGQPPMLLNLPGMSPAPLPVPC